VFIKQVPDTNDVKWTVNNNIDRAQMDCILNPVDKQAVEAALRIKEQYGAHTIAVTMGPSKAVNVLKEAVAMGIDDAVLLCDSKFAGSDTWATAQVLASVIREKFPDTDLLLFGQHAIDGETSQTGPSTAVRLNIPFLCHVNEITNVTNTDIYLNTETETNKTSYKIELPAALCINNFVFSPRIPRIQGYINSQNYNYKSYNLYELNLKETQTGIKGSPTYVSKVYKTDEKRNCCIIDTNENKDFSYSVIKEIKKVMES